MSVPWSERGVSTAAFQFFRNMGNAIAAAALGAVLTATLSPVLTSPPVQALVEQMPAAAQKANDDPSLGPVTPDAAYHGLQSIFERAGFTEAARRSPKRPIMRRKL